jgi:hypothetical protein
VVFAAGEVKLNELDRTARRVCQGGVACFVEADARGTAQGDSGIHVINDPVLAGMADDPRSDFAAPVSRCAVRYLPELPSGHDRLGSMPESLPE